MKRIASIMLLALSAACTTVEYSVMHRIDYFRFASITPDNTALVGTGTVDLHHFKKSFDKMYGTNEKLHAAALDSLQRRFQRALGGSAMPVLTDAAVVSAFTNQSPGVIPSDAFKTALAGLDREYVVCLRKVIIDQLDETVWNTGPNGVPMANSKTSALVTLEIEIWHTETQQKVYAFSTKDKASVSFMMFGTALRNAVDKALKGAVDYIKKGGVVT